MSSRGIVWSGSVLAVLAIAAVAGTYFVYPDFFQPPTVTTAAAIRAPVSEAIYGTGTVEPERWAKVVPLQRRRMVELCRCEGQAVKGGQVLGRQDDAEERNVKTSSKSTTDQLGVPMRFKTRCEAAKTEYEQRSLKFENPNRELAPKRYASTDSCFARRGWNGAASRRRGRRDCWTDRCAVLGRPASAYAGGG